MAGKFQWMDGMCDVNHIDLQDRTAWFPQRGYVGRRLAFGKPSSDCILQCTSHKIKARRDVPRMAENPISLRVVIQQLGVYPVPNYRVIVYGDELKPMHSDFGSAADLSKALGAAVPGFDISQSLLNPLQEGQGSIVFDGEMMLSSEQRSALGLK